MELGERDGIRRHVGVAGAGDATRRDEHHAAATAQHAKLVAAGRQYVTTDFVLCELVTQLYRMLATDQADSFISAVLAAIESDAYRLERITPERFQVAWQLRRKYADKPAISFVDFTSFVVMRDLAIQDAFTGDAHFAHVNMGFRLIP